MLSLRVGIHSNTIYRLVKFERAEYDTIKNSLTI